MTHLKFRNFKVRTKSDEAPVIEPFSLSLSMTLSLIFSIVGALAIIVSVFGYATPMYYDMAYRWWPAAFAIFYGTTYTIPEFFLIFSSGGTAIICSIFTLLGICWILGKLTDFRIKRRNAKESLKIAQLR